MPNSTAQLALISLVDVPNDINVKLSSASNQLLLSLLGSPAKNYDKNCGKVTNSKLLDRIRWGVDVGPFKVSGFDLAIDSLKEVMQEVKANKPCVYEYLESMGMLCCRLVRGGNTISNHSWGTAIDIKIAGNLDKPDDNKVQSGLVDIAPIFNKHGWFWGAGFKSWEDGMHFEVSKEKLIEWHKKGLLFESSSQPQLVALCMGSRGDDVVKLQRNLISLGYTLDADGIFGLATYAAIIAFQAANDLEPDGIVGQMTRQVIDNAISHSQHSISGNCINRKFFFNHVREYLFDGILQQDQVDGINVILDYWDNDLSKTSSRCLAYILATTYHETDRTMQPIHEKGSSEYFKKLYDINGENPERAAKMGNTLPGDGIKYHGRGYVQLTWKSNYQKFSNSLGLGDQLVNNPDLALREDIAVKILFEGMFNGMFTGKKLDDYLAENKDDWENARCVINGKNKAKEIADYAVIYCAAISYM
ncbi:MAG: hypothetical protein RI964_520 [Pseudomonadota bacterium]|jgi:hypothetical protein